jgi:hypothetical protein
MKSGMDASQKMDNFRTDLDIVMMEIREVLDHWGLKDWREYLVVRKPLEGSFVVLAHPTDKTDFAEKLVVLHKQDADDKTKPQCPYYRTDGQGGASYCILREGHEGEHRRHNQSEHSGLRKWRTSKRRQRENGIPRSVKSNV